MIEIRHYKPENLMQGVQPDAILFDGSIGDYVADTFEAGQPFMVFEGLPSADTDITHNIDAMLAGTEGEFTVTETAGAEGLAAQIIISLVISVALVALTPKPDLPDNVNRQQESPNNKLSSRRNEPRPLERVPDIKGRVLSVPDVVMPQYSVYENNDEIEYGFYCVGRKQLQIEDIKDGDTPLSLISGASAGVYYPNKSPNNASPDIQIGEAINEPVVIPYRNNQVNGETLTAPNDKGTVQADQLAFVNDGAGTGRIIGVLFNESPYGDATTTEVIFDDVQISNDGGVTFTDVSGTYTITSYGTNSTYVDLTGKPWNAVTGESAASQGWLYSSNTGVQRFSDWYYMSQDEFEYGFVNIIAANGMYKDNGQIRLQTSVEYSVEFEAVDIDGTPSGIVNTVSGVVIGDNGNLKGTTTRFYFGAATRFRCRVERITPTDYNYAGTVVDEVKLADIYAIKQLGTVDFGDVTTIQTKTRATESATRLKQRELNCIATEMLNVYQGSGVFASTLTANRSAVQSFITDAIDPVIGNLAITEIDADSILALDAEISSYFGLSEPTYCDYTFDSTDITFQDYAQILFNAINCIAYREAGIVSALFERPKDAPAMLFTHRSKQPNSERHSRNFNAATINDGVEFNYVDPVTNTTETIYLPSDKTAVNPRKYNIAGIRTEKSAIIRANREFNKLKHQKINNEVTVTAEGRFVKPADMVSIVKGTRVQTYDGEIIAQSGLELTLSADVAFVPADTHTIQLKQQDGNVESIVVTAGSAANKVILAYAPAETIRTDGTTRRTEFSFGNEARHEAEQWLVQEIDISDKWFVNLKAINYSDEYYADDTDSLSAYSSGYSSAYG